MTDEEFVTAMRARVEVLVPPIDVDASDIMARGRRRRAMHRGIVALVVAVVVVGVGWAGQVAVSGLTGRPTTLLPAGTGTGSSSAPPSDGPSAPQDADASAAALPAPVAPYGVAGLAVSADGSVTGVSGDPWPGDELYWHYGEDYRDGDGVTLTHRDYWLSRERPGLAVEGTGTDDAFAYGPSYVLGHYVIDGVDLQMLAEPAYLPVDPVELDAVIRASVAADAAIGAGRGPADQRVFQSATELLAWSNGTLPEPLRQALWAVAVAVPGAESRVGTDPDGRPAEIVHFTYALGDGPDVEYYRDAATGLVIATHYLDQDTWAVVTDQDPTSEIPMQPTLELAGCAMWATC
ncbi:hypothetical protein OEB99_14055 [Actinotalea sp. M2MS4P-6]|uniref:hypothetical protein n=1 Tax=Actinotalea sp. M2MS4P-6 TaxID=2983762 RepID=UPI0021E35B6C|nr:hypothetical protein [Actinotalea sp. M2MS4P-6]MCV2395436.1 hypothetical protein [Actinotalea sp. M2MS4P-6]